MESGSPVVHRLRIEGDDRMGLTRRVKALARSWGRGVFGRPVEPTPEGRFEPLISVIVPVYNVERYLSACLESLCAQTHRNLQVVLVDDGSTDSSLQIAEKFAATDSRLTIIRQENAGLGAARNAGIALVRGDYLAFLDSDDTLPRDAYQRLVSPLEDTNSDFSVGAITRVRANGTRSQPAWSRELHAVERLRMRPEEFPHILRDFYSPNKLYRTSFWNENEFRFREGVLFEDQPLITEIYCAASSIDVLTPITYEWLIRDDGSSLSQAMHTRRNVLQRAEALGLTLQALRDRNSAELTSGWKWTLQEHHFVNYISQAPSVEADAYEAMVDMIRSVIDEDDLVTTPGVSNFNNVLLYLALRSSRTNVESFLAAHGKNSYLFPVVLQDGATHSRLPFYGQPDPGVPLSLFGVAPHQVKLVAILRDYRWMEGNRLRVDGRVIMAHANASPPVAIARAYLFNAASLTEIPLEVSHTVPGDSDGGTAPIPEEPGFSLTVDFDQLSRTNADAFEPGAAWQVKLDVVGDSHRQSLGFTDRREARRSVARLSGTTVAPNLAIGARWAAENGLSFLVARRPIHASRVEIIGRNVNVGIDQRFGSFQPERAVLVSQATGEETFASLSRVGTSTLTACFELPSAFPAGQAWRAHVQDPTGSRRVVHASADIVRSANAGTSNARAATGPGSQLQIEAPDACLD